jgi:2,3-diketo-5-methylthio-1-phosphopentane phosphatase
MSDFDGTISKIDFFYYVIAKLLSVTDIQPWLDYQNGKIRHVEALTQIFKKIHLNKEDFHNLILELPIEESFVETVQYCRKNNIDFYIVSAGTDYYIKVILEHLKVADLVKVISNEGCYSVDQGLQILEPDKQNLFYSEEYGISKKLIAKSLKDKYDTVVFAGDGGPDIEAAQVADVVFAKDRLLELCEERNIKTIKLCSYCEILEYLKNG